MKQLVWVDSSVIDKVKDLDPDAVLAEQVNLSENAVIITYLGRGLTPDMFQKVSRKYKVMLEDSLASLEQKTKRKFELMFAQDDNHIRKADAGYMARLGWFRGTK